LLRNIGRKQAIHLAVRISLTAELFFLGRTSAFGRLQPFAVTPVRGRTFNGTGLKKTAKRLASDKLHYPRLEKQM